MKQDYLIREKVAKLQIPDTPQDFQRLCCKLWKLMSGDRTGHEFGSPGQEQQGVDVFVKFPFDQQLTAVQCKYKDTTRNQRLKAKEIDSECDKAKKNSLDIRTFVMATTSPIDQKIQRHCIGINNSNPPKYNFIVDTWFWDDIQEELKYYEEVKNRYSDGKFPEMQSAIALNPQLPNTRLEAFFSRPGLFNFLNRKAKLLYMHAIKEYSWNAFERGGAANIKVSVDGNELRIRDDGKKFNQLSLLDMEKGGGGRDTLKFLSTECDLSYEYDEKKKENIITIIPKKEFAEEEETSCYEISLRDCDLYGRKSMLEQIQREVGANLDNADVFILNMDGRMPIEMSPAYVIFDYMESHLKEGQTTKVYIPKDLYYKDILKDVYGQSGKIEFIERG